MSEPEVQHWVAECQYPQRLPFWVGSFALPAGLNKDEAQQKAIQAAIEFMEGIIPEWLSPPAVLQVARGTMDLVFEKDAA